MPYDDNGSYSRYQGPDRCKNDRDANIEILASKMDDEFNDISGAISEALPADGRKPLSGPIKMSGFAIKNIGAASAAADAPTAQQVQTSAFNYAEDISTAVNTVKIYLKPALDFQPNSLFLTIKIANSNTAASTLTVNTLPAKPILYGTSEIPEGTLMAGQIYFVAYNKTLDAYQILLSGSGTVPGSLPLFATITIAGLLTGTQANGWLLQGSKAYRSKYIIAYDQLEQEYLAAINAVETIKDKQFSYKRNPDTLRRFYSLPDYNARFELTGGSGGFVVDTDGKYFYLPKDINFTRPAVNLAEIGDFKDDTMRPITGKISVGQASLSEFFAEGAFEIIDDCPRHGDGDEPGYNTKGYKLNPAKLGANFAGTETAPKHHLETKYYRVDMAASNGIADINTIKELATQLATLKDEVKTLQNDLGFKLSPNDIIAGKNITIEKRQKPTEAK